MTLHPILAEKESASRQHDVGAKTNDHAVHCKDGEAALSPSWSLHSGVGLKNYSFVWAMGGENQVFDDMQGFSLEQIK